MRATVETWRLREVPEPPYPPGLGEWVLALVFAAAVVFDVLALLGVVR